MSLLPKGSIYLHVTHTVTMHQADRQSAEQLSSARDASAATALATCGIGALRLACSALDGNKTSRQEGLGDVVADAPRPSSGPSKSY